MFSGANLGSVQIMQIIITEGRLKVLDQSEPISGAILPTSFGKCWEVQVTCIYYYLA